MTEYKQFGESPSVTVQVTDKDDRIDDKSFVKVNWSTIGMCPVDKAHEFMNNLRRGINYARRHAKRQQKEALHDRTTAT